MTRPLNEVPLIKQTKDTTLIVAQSGAQK